MNRRPRSITVISWLFIAAGGVGFLYHLSELSGRVDFEAIAVVLLRVAAIVGGVFLLRGADWARWLLAGWMAYHLVLSAFHSATQFAVHVLLFGAIAYFLLRPRATAYFCGSRAAAPPASDATCLPD